MTYANKYKNELEYIDKFWDKVTVKPKRTDRLFNIILRRTTKRMHENIIHIPNAFIVPNDKKFTHVFYWDTFFIFKGLLGTKREKILRPMVDNFIYLYEKYGIIPNFNSPASTGRSQPPFLTSMILDTYNRAHKDYLFSKEISKTMKIETRLNWLRKAAEIAKREYWHVWENENLFYHKVKGLNLNRYGDRDIGYAHSSELESGWDFTSRFYNRCNEFLPIDLNCYLFKYERDFAKIGKILGDSHEQKFWSGKALARQKLVNKYMWNRKNGLFFDYDYVNGRQSDFLSLASFIPLWAGLATPAQAKLMVKKLKDFETDYGLLIGAKKSLAPNVELSKIPAQYKPAIRDILKPKQWDYPNIWPPIEYLTVIGLLKYGFTNDAIRIMKKSLAAQSKIFSKYKTFFEKIDGVRGDLAKNYHYENQSGFGWTNAIFTRYVAILDAIEQGLKIHTSNRSKKPPYKLAIPH